MICVLCELNGLQFWLKHEHQCTSRYLAQYPEKSHSQHGGSTLSPMAPRHPYLNPPSPLSLAAVVVSFFLSVPCVLHATRGVPHCFFHRRPSSSSSSSSPPQPQPLVQYPRHHSNPPQGNTDVDDVKLFLNFFIFFSKLKSRQHRSQCPQ